MALGASLTPTGCQNDQLGWQITGRMVPVLAMLKDAADRHILIADELCIERDPDFHLRRDIVAPPLLHLR